MQKNLGGMMAKRDKKRKPAGKPGRKRGSHIKCGVAVKPFGVKSGDFDIRARAAVVALNNGVANQDHFVSLYVLGDLCRQMGAEPHVLSHAATLMRMCASLNSEDRQATELECLSLGVSADVLLRWFEQQSNYMIATKAADAIRRIEAGNP